MPTVKKALTVIATAATPIGVSTMREVYKQKRAECGYLLGEIVMDRRAFAE
jgi:hypothetical protein